MSNNHKNKDRRKKNYDSLRAVGYTSREANRIKDFSDSRIKELIALKEKQNDEMSSVLNVGGK